MRRADTQIYGLKGPHDVFNGTNAIQVCVCVCVCVCARARSCACVRARLRAPCRCLCVCLCARAARPFVCVRGSRPHTF